MKLSESIISITVDPSTAGIHIIALRSGVEAEMII